MTDGRYDYFGNRVETMRHGVYGIMLMINTQRVLTIYEGSWDSDTFHGKGTLFVFSHPESKDEVRRVMEGNWNNGMLHGRGIIKSYDIHTKKWKIAYEG